MAHHRIGTTALGLSLLVACGGPPGEPELCFEGAAVAYVAVYDEASSGPGPALDAIAVTDIQGNVHWATQQFEGSYVAMTGEPEPRELLGEPDASCDGGYVHLSSNGATIVGFDFLQPILAETVSVYTADGCEYPSVYRVVTTVDDRDESWRTVATATGTTTLTLPSPCDEPPEPSFGRL